MGNTPALLAVPAVYFSIFFFRRCYRPCGRSVLVHTAQQISIRAPGAPFSSEKKLYKCTAEARWVVVSRAHVSSGPFGLSKGTYSPFI